jgi:hypothetical protein
MLAATLMPVLLGGLLSVQGSVTTWLVFDPTADNRLVIETPASLGGTTGTSLVGGVLATLRFDLVKLATNLPLSIDVDVREIRVAGDSFAPLPVFPTTQTGTICVTADPDDPGSGTVTLPLLGPPHIVADMRTRTFLTSSLGGLFPDGIALSARIEDDLAIDLRALILNRFAAGPVAVDTEARGVIPPDILLLGGFPFSLQVKILNSLQPRHDPLLDECATFLASH